MLIVELNGGLGNQMFQYALYLKLKALGKDVYIDDEIIVNKLNNSRALKIFDVFDLDFEYCKKSVRNKMADVSIDPISRLRRKYLGTTPHPDTLYTEMDLDNNYQPEIFEMDDKYISGCWQSEKYFDEIRGTILDNYTFKIHESEVDSYLSAITSETSVSIHVRRGDYVGNAPYEGICTEEYYDSAIKYIKEHVKNPVFYVFSDDPEYAKRQFAGNEYKVVESFDGSKSHYDMFLMSQCKHNIVANSSFSWWGAWLNQNPEKIVVCPERWSSKWGLKYTPCESWVKI